MRTIKFWHFGVQWKPIFRLEMWTQHPRGFWRSANKAAIGIGPIVFWHRK